MSKRVFVDPGKHANAIASWLDGEFVGVTYRRHTPPGEKLPNYREMMLEVELLRPSFLLIEKPMSYTLQQQKGDQNDLIDVAMSAAACAAACGVVEFVSPLDWTKGTDKALRHRRLESRLTPAMLHALSVIPAGVRHNAVDAIGLGLWWLDRHPGKWLPYAPR